MSVTRGFALAWAETVQADRWFTVNTGQTNDYNATGSEPWEMDAGGFIDLYFYTGTFGTGLAPDPPDGDGDDVVQIHARTETGSIIRTLYHSSTPPANGQSFRLYATHNGFSNGSPRVGTIEIYVRVRQDNELVNNYDVRSTDAEGTIGKIRCNIVEHGLDHSGYPAGSTYAVGTAGTESVSVSLNHDPPFQNYSYQDIRLSIVDGGVVQAAGALQDYTGTSSSETFNVNKTVFDDTSKTYNVRAEISGNSALQSDVGGGTEKWAAIVPGGGSTVVDAQTVDSTQTFDVDPRVSLANVNPTESLYNRGESTGISFNIQNARSENLSKSTTLTLRDSLAASKKSITAVGALYSMSYTIAAGDDAAADTTGKQWAIDADSVDGEFSMASANAFGVSSYRVIHSSSTLPGGDPNNADGTANATPADVGTANPGVFNRGETVSIDYYLFGARGTPWFNSFTSKVLNVSSGEEDSVTESTDVNGKVDYSYVISATDEALGDTIGSGKKVEVSSADGNITVTTGNDWFVSTLRKIHSSSTLPSGDPLNADNKVVSTAVGDVGSVNLNTFNRGESVTIDYYIFGVRGQAWQLAVDSKVISDSGSVEDLNSSITPQVSGLVSYSYAIGSTDQAVSSVAGSPKHIRVEDAFSNDVVNSDDDWSVSTYRSIHSTGALPGSNPENADGVVNAATATSNDGGGGDRSLVNYGESVNISYYVFGVRGQNWPFSVDSYVIADDGSVDHTSLQSVTSGLVSYSYTASSPDKASASGSLKHIRIDSSTNGDSNDTVNSSDQWSVSNELPIGSAVSTTGDGNVAVEVGSHGSGDDGTMSGVYSYPLFNCDSGEQPVALTYYLSYKRGTPYASKTINASILNEGGFTEDSQSVSTDLNGKIAYTYSISESDQKAGEVPRITSGYSSLPSGSGKFCKAEHLSNSTQNSNRALEVTSHLWVDIHDQRETPLVKDSWDVSNPISGLENVQEEEIGYVLLGNQMQLWTHVMSVRLDREIETWDGDTGAYPDNRSVRMSTIKPNGITDKTLLTDTGSTGWTSGLDINEDGELDGNPNDSTEQSWIVDPASPASANWIIKSEVSHGGNAGSATDRVNVISPLDSDKDIRMFCPTIVGPAEQFRVYMLCLQKSTPDGETTSTFQPKDPDNLPQIRIGEVSGGVHIDSVASRPANNEGQDMLNAVDDTATVNGSLYYFDVTAPVVPGVFYDVWVHAQISGSPIKGHSNFKIKVKDFDPLGEITS